MYDEKAIAEAVKKAVEQMQQAESGDDNDIKIGISARHVHLSREDLDTLFGKGFELTKKNANNVALLVDGDEKMANKLLEILETTGTNVFEDVLYVKMGGLPFLGGKVSEDEKNALISWINDKVNNLK